jgi:hypothetical protein
LWSGSSRGNYIISATTDEQACNYSNSRTTPFCDNKFSMTYNQPRDTSLTWDCLGGGMNSVHLIFWVNGANNDITCKLFVLLSPTDKPTGNRGGDSHYDRREVIVRKHENVARSITDGAIRRTSYHGLVIDQLALMSDSLFIVVLISGGSAILPHKICLRERMEHQCCCCW